MHRWKSGCDQLHGAWRHIRHLGRSAETGNTWEYMAVFYRIMLVVHVEVAEDPLNLFLGLLLD